MKLVRSVEAGFSLVEVMVAGAIMAFFAMVLLQSNELQTRMMTTNEAQMETFTLLFQVQQVMTDPISCSISIGQAFGRVTDLHDLGKNGPAPVPALFRAFKNASGHFEAVKFLVPGKIIGNNVLKITDLQVEPHKIFDGQVDLIIRLERMKKGVFGGVESVKRIAINVDLVGPDHANAFDGIMCLNPGQPTVSGSTARDVQNVLESGITTDGGSAKVSTENLLAKACADTGGTWNVRENRCANDASAATSDALKAACSAAGGQWDDTSHHCGVAAH